MPKTEIQLRPIHTPITSEPANAIRAAAHGDINLITLMGARKITSSNHNGDWIDAIAEPDELVINVGDMLSRHQ
jgi:isopenicillin N synthase-like dioxygenase